MLMAFWSSANYSDFPTDKTFNQFHYLDTEFYLHRITSGFHGAIATGVACQQGMLTLPEPGSGPFWEKKNEVWLSRMTKGPIPTDNIITNWQHKNATKKSIILVDSGPTLDGKLEKQQSSNWFDETRERVPNLPTYHNSRVINMINI